MRLRVHGSVAAVAVAALAAFAIVCARPRGILVPDVGVPVPSEDAPQPPNSIAGTLVRVDHVVGRSMVRAAETGRAVRLEIQGEAPRTATTDAWGRFTFPDVPPGRRHALVVVAEGCGPIRLAVGPLLPGERVDVGPLHLGEPETSKVTVTDEEGRPIQGAVVEAYADVYDRGYESGVYRPADDLTFEAEPSVTGATGADGVAALPLFSWRTWTYVAHAPGKARTAAPTNRAEPHIALPDPAPVRGTVRDAAGRPVAGALVLARLAPPIKDDHHGARYDSAARWQRTTSGADGTFSFDTLPPGVIDLLAGPPGAAPFATACIRTPDCTTADIEVPELARFRGQVTDEDGRAPLAGITVTVQERNLGTGWRCVTDAEGRYDLAAPATGVRDLAQEWVEVVAPGGWTTTSETPYLHQSVVAGEERVRDARLGRGRTGTIVCRVPAARAPDTAVAVVVCRLVDGVPSVPVRGWCVDADGRVRIEGVEPGRIGVLAALQTGDYFRDETTWMNVDDAVEADAHALDRVWFELPAGHAVTVELDPLPPAPPLPKEAWEPEDSSRLDVSVRVRVRTADGLPLRNAWAWVTSSRPPKARAPEHAAKPEPVCCPPTARAQDDDSPGWTPAFGRPVRCDGAYEDTERAAPGDWIWAVAADDRHPRSWSRVAAPADGGAVALEVVLPAAPVVRGVVTADGAPVAGARVFESGAECARTAADGAFVVTSLGGRRWVTIDAPGFLLESRSLWIDGTGSGAPADEEVEIRLSRARTLTGRVLDGSGRPVSGVRVTWEAESASGYETASKEDGSFVLRRVPEVPVRLRVASNASSREPIGSVVTPLVASETAVTDIVVLPALAIEGRVVRADGTAVENADVLCEATDPRTWVDDAARSVRTDREGRFRVPRLADGEFEVRTASPSDPTSSGVTARVRAGAKGVELRVR